MKHTNFWVKINFLEINQKKKIKFLEDQYLQSKILKKETNLLNKILKESGLEMEYLRFIMKNY